MKKLIIVALFFFSSASFGATSCIQGNWFSSEFIHIDNIVLKVNFWAVGEDFYLFPPAAAESDGTMHNIKTESYTLSGCSKVIYGRWVRSGATGSFRFTFEYDSFNRPIKFDGNYTQDSHPAGSPFLYWKGAVL
jgi:hypothetical protein